MATSKSVAKVEDQVPAYIQQNSARGSEQVETGDITLPRVDIIQDLSPEHKENKPEYIKGAKPGMLFNTLTRDLYPEGVRVVPVWYERQHLVWKDQDKGGGLQGIFPDEPTAQQAAASDSDFEYVATPTHLCLLLDDSGDFIMEVTIPMPKSKNKVNRKWNSMIKLTGMDRFARVYRFTAVEEQNNAGQDYYNYELAFDGYPSEEVYRAAERLYEQVSAGMRSATPAYEAEPGGEPPADEEY